MRVELAEVLEPRLVYDRYHPTYVLAPHDDGTWVRATLLSQH